MNNYYVETVVSYSDNNGEPYNGSEYFTYIIQSNNKKEAKEEAKKKSLANFSEQFNDGFNNITCKVDDIYETSDDATI